MPDAQLHFAAFLPFRRSGTEYEFYLQKRDMKAKRSPGLFGLFGGAVEDGEGLQAAMMREVYEELTYTPRMPKFFANYETSLGPVHVFVEEVRENFESLVDIQEGECGVFFTVAETGSLETAPIVKEAVADLNRTLHVS